MGRAPGPPDGRGRRRRKPRNLWPESRVNPGKACLLPRRSPQAPGAPASPRRPGLCFAQAPGPTLSPAVLDRSDQSTETCLLHRLQRMPGRLAQAPRSHPSAAGRCPGRLPAGHHAYESGQRRVPISSLLLLASMLGVSVEALIGAPAKRGAGKRGLRRISSSACTRYPAEVRDANRSAAARPRRP